MCRVSKLRWFKRGFRTSSRKVGVSEPSTNGSEIFDVGLFELLSKDTFLGLDLEIVQIHHKERSYRNTHNVFGGEEDAKYNEDQPEIHGVSSPSIDPSGDEAGSFLRTKWIDGGCGLFELHRGKCGDRDPEADKEG